MSRHFLDPLFAPAAVAVFGASQRSEAVGTRLYENLLHADFSGAVYAINPKYERLGDETCYASIEQIHEKIDLAVITTPARTVPEIVRQCGEHGVRAAVVVSAGFGEGKGEGAHLQQQVLQQAGQYRMRILGPNCLGIMRPERRLNATFSNSMAQAGSLALVSQSGALCTAILDWADARHIGFSAVVSLGGAADIDFGDILDYLALDPKTRSILLYVEGIHQARRFISGLRVAARFKPVVVVKVGRHKEGSRAVVSHTGAMVGEDDVFDAALQRTGAVRVMTIEQLFAAAQLLATHQRVKNNRLAIVTNGGGPGVMATDRAVDLGISVATLSEDTINKLNEALPGQWSHGNPVDVLGDAPPERYQTAVQACLLDENVDGVLTMLTPQAMTKPEAVARLLVELKRNAHKPLLACWMGETQVKYARELFARYQLPDFQTPEASVEAFAYLNNYHKNQQLLMQVPGPLSSRVKADTEGARLIADGVLSKHRTLMNLLESQALLTAFGMPVNTAILARSANEALVAAESIGFPVALKIQSPDIIHKSDVHGVRLNVIDAYSIRHAYTDLIAGVKAVRSDICIDGVTVEKMISKPHGREIIIGVVRDPVFGPVISFGLGGTAVEVLRDRAVALPPLNSFIARALIRQTRVSELLEEYRDYPAANLDALEHVLRCVSNMVCELPCLKELDINPLLIDDAGATVLDARIVIDSETKLLSQYEHMAIYPYPSELKTKWQLADGTDIVIRPIRPEDAKIEQDFVRRLSPRAKYFRFMQTLQTLTPEMLVRFTQIDYDREMAFIAVVEQAGEEIETGVARYTANPDGETCEFALVVDDRWQHKGIGTHLMNALIQVAAARGLQYMQGEVLADNVDMLNLVLALGFVKTWHPQDRSIVVVTRRL
ncbi:bifunctional acetate--CoA ligase family protein/GNAT family N-acetyltransferase [Nitrosomonas marina]|uniref:Acetyltransferase n=1 Tax=Nitrosomonas marina TaxID=917 RepID=A0A1H8E4C4_9PROT|nr:bifunctional acetate--CoA ligase family protein/GNAT family N-acetyltransferase [Nitrosomonas marina]SEN14290.1 acetyltransferase [Nitrosomonas marina]